MSLFSFPKRIILSLGKRAFRENNNFKVNWLRTYYFNFRVFPFRVAIKLPVYFYGKVYFISLDGKVNIEGPISMGMIKFGQNRDVVSGKKGNALISLPNNSDLTFRGPALFYQDYLLRLTSGAKVVIGKYVVIGSNVKICCSKEVIIGDNTGIGFDSQVIDTNFHYMYDALTNKVQNKDGIIHLGKNNWVGNRSSILKGTKTHDNTTVSSGSMLNKNYCNITNEDGIILAGSPAKVIKSNFFKIVSPDLENRITKYFIENESQNEFILNNFLENNMNDRNEIFS